MSPRHIWPTYTCTKWRPSVFGSLETNVMIWTGTGLSRSHCCQVMQNVMQNRHDGSILRTSCSRALPTTCESLHNQICTTWPGALERSRVQTHHQFWNDKRLFNQLSVQVYPSETSGVWRATKPIVNICSSAGILLSSVHYICWSVCAVWGLQVVRTHTGVSLKTHQSFFSRRDHDSYIDFSEEKRGQRVWSVWVRERKSDKTGKCTNAVCNLLEWAFHTGVHSTRASHRHISDQLWDQGDTHLWSRPTFQILQ